MIEQLSWYVARSAGIMAWVMAVSNVALGLLTVTRILGPRPRAPWLVDVHRMLSVLAVVFTAIHVGAIVADNYVHFGLADIFVPMASEWRPGAVAWGIVALYLLAAIEITSRLRKWLPERFWRTVHFSSIALAITASVHGWQAGTDAENALLIAPSVALLVATAGLFWWRLRHGRVAAATLAAERSTA